VRPYKTHLLCKDDTQHFEVFKKQIKSQVRSYQLPLHFVSTSLS
jgi:hypothetical protein